MPQINGLEVNSAQYEAIIHRNGPAIVIAGPGSGKTTVITQRIKYLIEQYHIKPEEILVITFTKAAASEMQERFLHIMDTEACHVTFGTFHAIYFHILKQAYHYQQNNILTETEKYTYLKEAMQCNDDISESAQEDAMLQNDIMQLLLQEIAQVKNEGISIQKYTSHTMEATAFRQVYRQYQRILMEHRKLDFEDMVLQCYQLLEQREDILCGWRRRFSYILIDEFQDIAPMQFAVIRQLAAPRNNLFIVGDDDQSIYSFRGATPQIMLQFPTLYADAKKIILNINYRCQEDILKAATSLISHNTNRFPKQILPYFHKKTDAVSYQTYASETEQGEAIVNYVVEHIKSGGKYSDLAILYRTNTTASKMAERFMAFHIPFEMKEKIQNRYNSFYAQDIIAYIRFAMGENTRKLFYQFMNRPVRYIQRNALVSKTVTKEELLQYYADKEYVCKAVEQLWTQLLLIKEMSPFAAINFIRKGIGYDAYLEKIAQENTERLTEWLDRLDEIQQLSSTFDTLQEWLTHIENYTREIREIKKKKEDAVEIMTMHAAKGLEWKQVWIPDLNEGVVPHKKAQLPEELEEERRMLYVAMTRARERLVLSAISPHAHRQEQSKRISRFIKEIN